MTPSMQPAAPVSSPPGAAPGAPSAPFDALDTLAIPVPCTVPWETMTGDDRVRYCGKCRLHVHDLSALTREDALAFLFARVPGQRVCVQIHRRPDGRVITADCRKAVRAIRRRALLVTAAVLGALGLGGAAWARAASADFDGGLSNPDTWDRQPFRAVARIIPASWLPARRFTGSTLRGDVAMPMPRGTPVPSSAPPETPR